MRGKAASKEFAAATKCYFHPVSVVVDADVVCSVVFVLQGFEIVLLDLGNIPDDLLLSMMAIFRLTVLGPALTERQSCSLWCKYRGRSRALFAVTLVFLCLSFIAVALRCFVRLRLVKAFGWDDGLMVLAMLFDIWFATCGLAGAVAGFGKRFDQFNTRADVQTALLWWWLGQSAYVWVVATARISIAMLLLRLTGRRRESAVLYIVIGLTSTVGLAFWLILMLQCHPVSEFWERTGGGHCIDTNYVLDIAYLYSATACLCDFTLGLFPIYLLKDLHMSRRSKWAIAIVLSMGCVAGAAVAVRIPYLPNYKDPDFLYATTGIAISSNIEAGLGITAGSLITLRPLMRWLRCVCHRVFNKARGVSRGIRLCSSNRTQRSPVKQKHNSPKHWRSDIESAMPVPMPLSHPSQTEEPQFGAGAM
ncbi:putative integral membrane protein [Aspergillus thermomutatus]|uniref:Rhodopsin domain-containing protein n=1 Tax=Aspergillus thermomutatus TaxID=41047 RepID=A0A397FX59_ASPTH|nr:uncharacterized protein CDV56_101104 [Aspergillus thermomutatus]RHZ43187.1 hypothetical protein CDV56_101104 [Aspergillus thermomutatus]